MKITKPYRAAILGSSLVLPFTILNFIVVSRFQPLFSWIRPGNSTGRLEMVLLGASLLLILLGAIIAARPVWVNHKLHWINGVIALILLIIFCVLAVEVGGEIYRCDVQIVPNCD